MRVNIIGGGLAGCALAYALKKAGAEPVIYEASSALASGASGNDVGLYNPRFTAEFDAVGQFYSLAFHEALKVFEELGDAIDWNPCGALHLITDEKKVRRFPKTVESWSWPEEDMRIVSAAQASELSGVNIPVDCFHLKRSGKISPKKLCCAYVKGVEVHLNTKVENISALDGVTVLANGMGVQKFAQAAYLPLKAVRGQVSYGRATESSEKLRCALCYGGYIAPAQDGAHCIGATFQRWLDHSDIIPEDNAENLGKLHEALPALGSVTEIVANRAAVRTTSHDHFPIVGELEEGLYVSTAHGSHGILSSLLSAKILSAFLFEKEGVVGVDVLNALSPARFL